MDQKEGQNHQNQEHLYSSRLHHDCKGPAETEEVQHHKMIKKQDVVYQAPVHLCRHRVLESCHTASVAL